MTVSRIDETGLPEIDASLLGDLPDLHDRTDENGNDQALLAGLDRAGDRALFTRMGDRGWYGLQRSAPFE
jgi:hypothetical protein